MSSNYLLKLKLKKRWQAPDCCLKTSNQENSFHSSLYVSPFKYITFSIAITEYTEIGENETVFYQTGHVHLTLAI